MTALVLPAQVLGVAGSFFEECGMHGNEGTALIKAGPRGVALVVPEQTPRRTSYGGVSVEVTRAGQMQLAMALDADERYVSRIHSHPAEAFHSAADDANPVLTFTGALSIVVPYFGLGLRRGLDACAVFRLENGVWHRLDVGPERDRWVVCGPPDGEQS